MVEWCLVARFNGTRNGTRHIRPMSGDWETRTHTRPHEHTTSHAMGGAAAACGVAPGVRVAACSGPVSLPEIQYKLTDSINLYNT